MVLIIWSVLRKTSFLQWKISHKGQTMCDPVYSIKVGVVDSASYTLNEQRKIIRVFTILHQIISIY